MTREEGNVWKADISDASDHVIFCRCNSSMTAPEWGDGKVWNKTSDLSVSSNQNLYTITGWGGETSTGSWSTYGNGGEGGDQGGEGGGQGGQGGSGNTAGKNF